MLHFVQHDNPLVFCRLSSDERGSKHSGGSVKRSLAMAFPEPRDSIAKAHGLDAATPGLIHPISCDRAVWVDAVPTKPGLLLTPRLPNQLPGRGQQDRGQSDFDQVADEERVQAGSQDAAAAERPADEIDQNR